MRKIHHTEILQSHRQANAAQTSKEAARSPE